MKQLHICESIGKSFGGMGLAAVRYAEALSMKGVQIIFLSLTRNEVEWEYNRTSHLKVRYWRLATLFSVLTGKIFSGVDIVHIHGMWLPKLVFIGCLARLYGCSIIISPHGTLEEWALKYKFLKKKFALLTYQRLLLMAANVFVATAHSEKISIRKVLATKRIVIIPNGVDLPSDVSLHSRCSEVKYAKRFLYLSRIHPIKGIDLLLRAWAKSDIKNSSLVIAGAGQADYVERLQGLVRDLKLGDSVTFVGELQGVNKEQAFYAADVFVLPTYSENFGLVVAEALIRGIPVITTTGAPWIEIQKFNCGWWVDPDVESLSKAITEAVMGDSNSLRAMGERGRQLCLSKYTWDSIGHRALEVSNEILDRKR